MDERTYNKIIQEGYELSPLHSRDELYEREEYELRYISSTMIKESFQHINKPIDLFISKKSVLVFLKFATIYEFKLDDIKAFLNNIIKQNLTLDDFYRWRSDFFSPFGLLYHYISPNKYEAIKDSDYLCDTDTKLVLASIEYLSNFAESETFIEQVKQQIIIIDEVINNRSYPIINRNYSLNTLAFLISALHSVIGYEHSPVDTDILKFYSQSILSLVNKSNYQAIYTLAYDYYEGNQVFPLDKTLSLKYLIQAYQMKEDPDIACTIGYISFYGWANNGQPDKDQAFRYFSLAHHASHNHEATYKLADCYLKGYGTPVSKKAAYNLVDNLYEETWRELRRGNYACKYADVVLRLATFYREGIYVEQDKQFALDLFLRARAAIKERIKQIDYVGDKGLANGISASIRELSSKTKRKITHKGYDITKEFIEKKTCINWDVNDYRLEKEGLVGSVSYLNSQQDNGYFLDCWPEIGYSALVKSLKFIFVLSKEDRKRYQEFEKKEDFSMKIKDGKILIQSRKFACVIKPLQVIDVPMENVSLNPDYLLARVQFPNSEKTYEYLSSNKQVKIGDTAMVMTRRGQVKVKVVALENIYEDQLPLPLNKFEKLI